MLLVNSRTAAAYCLVLPRGGLLSNRWLDRFSLIYSYFVLFTPASTNVRNWTTSFLFLNYNCILNNWTTARYKYIVHTYYTTILLRYSHTIFTSQLGITQLPIKI